MGSRYGGLKQADPMGPNGETVLDYSVFDAIRAGFGRVVFVIRKDFAEAFEARVASRFSDRIPIDFTYQDLNDLPAGFSVPEGREKPWGTGHAVLTARDTIRENFAVINADDFYGRDAYGKMGGFLSSAGEKDGVAEYAMVGYELRQTLSEHGSVARGICHVDKDHHLVSVQEMTKIFATPEGAEHREENGELFPLTGHEMVSMNFWGFTPKAFDHLGQQFETFLRKNESSPKAEFYIPLAIDATIGESQATVTVLETSSEWFGVTYREDKPHVQESIRRLIASGDYPEKL